VTRKRSRWVIDVISKDILVLCDITLVFCLIGCFVRSYTKVPAVISIHFIRDLTFSIYGSTVLLLYFGCLFSVLILYTVGRSPRTGDQPVSRPLHTHRTTQTQNKRTQASILLVEFEPTILVLEWAKTILVLDRATTMTSSVVFTRVEFRIFVFLDHADGY
jgi:hypothetical protein